MKNSLYGIVFFTSIILTACSTGRNTQQSYYEEPSNSVSYQQFYDDLSPYGQWMNDPDYGYVWRPGDAGFRPYYSNGNWAYTNYGWTWVSDYSWGWAPFHYGRWFFDNFYGWMWVPGYEWAPAWVSWRGNSQYYGWAPLCPQGINGRNYQIGYDQWAFVPQQYITRRDINNYYVNEQNNYTIINNTTVLNKTHVSRSVNRYPQGPNVMEVERATNARITPLQVERSTSPGAPQVQNGALHIFKPEFKGKISRTERPGQVVNINGSDLQPVSRGQVNANDTKINTRERFIKKPVDGQVNRGNVPAEETRPAVKNPVNQPAFDPAANTESQVNPNRRIRQLPNRQMQPDNVRPVDQTPASQQNQTRQPAQLNQERRINVMPERTPTQRQALPDNNERRTINIQNQNPSFNQRPLREQQSPNFDRPSPSSFERRSQPLPAPLPRK